MLTSCPCSSCSFLCPPVILDSVVPSTFLLVGSGKLNCITARSRSRSWCLCPNVVSGDSDRLREFVLLCLRLFPGSSCLCAAGSLGSGSRMSFDPQAPGVYAVSGICPFCGHDRGTVMEWGAWSCWAREWSTPICSSAWICWAESAPICSSAWICWAKALSASICTVCASGVMGEARISSLISSVKTPSGSSLTSKSGRESVGLLWYPLGGLRISFWSPPPTGYCSSTGSGGPSSIIPPCLGF